MTWLAGWNKRAKFSINSINVAETLYNFPVLIKLDETSDIFTELGVNNRRILFRSNEFEEQFYCEISQWDSVGKLATLWVKIPVISSTVTTEFYMFYDNSQNDNTSYISLTGIGYWEESSGYTTGVLSGAASIVSNYIRLTTAATNTSGAYTINNITLQPEFTVKYDHWSGGGNGADWIQFGWGQTGINQYSVTIDEYNDRIYFSYNGSSPQIISGVANIDNSTWREVIIQTTLIDNNLNTQLFFGGTQYINYSVPYIKNIYPGFYWLAACGGYTNEHRIRNLRVYNKGQGSGGIWDDNFIAAYHMNQDPAVYALADSTSRAIYGVPAGSMTVANLVDGLVDKALTFDGMANYININNCCASISITSCFTFSCVINKSTTSATKDAIIWSMSGPSSGNNRLIFGVLANTNVLNIQLYNVSTQLVANISGTTNVCDGTFREIAVVYDNATKFVAIYLAGVLEVSLFSTTAWSWAVESSARANIGQRYNSSTPTDFFSGIIDEVFISNKLLKVSKLLALNKIKNNTFITYGAKSETITSSTLPYANKITLTIPYGNILNTLYNFPVLINLTKTSGFNKQDVTKLFNVLEGPENRKKIAITDYTGVAMCYTEIECWAHSEKTAQLWVKVPVISSTVDTILYLYYDKTASDNILIGDFLSVNAKKVWSSNFFSVYNTSQNPYPYVYDSSINKLDLPVKGSTNSTNIVTTSIGSSYYFDGASSIGKATSIAYAPVNNFSFECICKALTTHEIDTQSNNSSNTTGTSGQKYVFLTPQDADINIATAGLSVGTNGVSVYEWASGYLAPTAVYAATLTDYMHICVVYVNKTACLYVNGVKVVTGLASAKTTVRCSTDFGGNPNYGYFNGYIGKVRIANIALSDAWIKATYLSNFDNLITYTLASYTVGWLGTYENGGLSPWTKRIRLEVDCTKIGSPLTNFPLLVSLSSTSGITHKDVTDVYNTLTTVASTTDTAAVLLLHAEELIDSSSYKLVLTNLNSNVTITASQRKFGNNSLYFTGSLGCYLSVPNSSYWSFGLEDFTIDCWVYLLNRTFTIISIGSYTVGLAISVSSTTLYIALGGTWQGVPVGALALNAWVHIAVTRKDGSVRVFFNGILQAGVLTDLTTKSCLPSSNIVIGADLNSFSNACLNGYLDELRIVRGRCDWYTDFTVPSSAHTGLVDIATTTIKKIAITSDDGITQLPIEVECIDNNLSLWTKVPQIKTVDNTVLYLYYDNTKTDNSNYVDYIGSSIGTSVWSSNNALGVYHLSQNPKLTILDSTSNYYNLTPNGSMASLQYVHTGRELIFDGVDDYLANSNLRFPLNLTVLCRCYINSLSITNTIAQQGQNNANPGQGTLLSIGTDGKISVTYFNAGAGWVSVTSQNPVATGENTIGIVVNSSNLTYSFYINNTKESGVLPYTLVASTYPFKIGAHYNAGMTNFFNGRIREFRVINNTTDVSAYFNTVKEYFNDNLITYNTSEVYVAPIVTTENYNYVGYVNLKGQPIIRTVLLYERSTGLLVDSTTSDQTGFYNLLCHKNVEHFIVVLDDVNTFIYEPLVKDRLLPNGV